MVSTLFRASLPACGVRDWGEGRGEKRMEWVLPFSQTSLLACKAPHPCPSPRKRGEGFRKADPRALLGEGFRGPRARVPNDR